MVARPVSVAIALRGVSFRYGRFEPEIVAVVDLSVSAGDFLAITGPSGAGKTTLLKLMVGLPPPTSGQVLVDGRPLDPVGMAAYRAQIGVVMQDDHLLCGSIAENIAFFEPRPDLAWIRDCARLAGIDDEVMDMPMTYGTLVGDMGLALSGGQRQRLLLARALYRRPRILMMDEGASHRDLDRERQVNAALATLEITRVVIAHRPETIAAAHRVVRLHQAPLEPVRQSMGIAAE